MTGLIAWLIANEEWIRPFSNLVTLVGVGALFMTWRGLVTQTTATLSQRMFEINKLEYEHPEMFQLLGGNGTLRTNAYNCDAVQKAQHEFFFVLRDVRGARSLRIDPGGAQRLQAVFSVVLEALCNEEDTSLDPKKQVQDKEKSQKLIHYLFILFSFYEQLYLLKRGTHLSFHQSWETRFRNHMRERPIFSMFWYACYCQQSSEEFKNFANYIVRENELPPPNAVELVSMICRFFVRKINRIFSCVADCFR